MLVQGKSGTILEKLALEYNWIQWISLAKVVINVPPIISPALPTHQIAASHKLHTVRCDRQSTEIQKVFQKIQMNPRHVYMCNNPLAISNA